MRIFISADIEGAGGVAVSGHGSPTDPLYQHARAWMTDDVNAVIAGCFAGGATSVCVKDAHGPATNLLYHELDERAELVTGWGPLGSMVEGLDESCAGLMLIGYHSRAGTEQGVLSHSFMRHIENLVLDGSCVGETGIAAAYAGHFRVPVALVAGDEAVTAEAAELLPHVTVCAVKRGLNRNCAVTQSTARRRELLSACAAEALAARDRTAPFRPRPVLEVRWCQEVIAEQTSFVPGVERLDARTIRFRAADMLELNRVFRVTRHIAARY